MGHQKYSAEATKQDDEEYVLGHFGGSLVLAQKPPSHFPMNAFPDVDRGKLL